MRKYLLTTYLFLGMALLQPLKATAEEHLIPEHDEIVLINDHTKISLATFDFNKRYPDPCQPSGPCYTVEDLVEYSLKHSYDSREKIERLFQVRAAILERLGRVLPHLNISSAFNVVQGGLFELTASFVGFLFPNRILDWQEKRKEAASELESFKTLLADRAMAVKNIYYSIQLQVWSLRILEHYINEIRLITAFAEAQKAAGRNVSEETLALFRTMEAKLRYDHAIIDNISASFPELAQAIGLEIDAAGKRLPIRNRSIKALKHIPPLTEKDNISLALDRSTELSGIEFMIAAAKLNKKSNYFEFFDWESGNDLGLGWGQRIKISRAAITILEIQKERTRSQIMLNIFKATNNYNDGLAASRATEIGLQQIQIVRKAIENHLESISIPLDINAIPRYLEAAIGTDLRYCTAYFLFRNAKTNLDRLTWTGESYKTVIEYISNNIEKDYKVVKKSHGWRRIFKRSKESSEEDDITPTQI